MARYRRPKRSTMRSICTCAVRLSVAVEAGRSAGAHPFFVGTRLSREPLAQRLIAAHHRRIKIVLGGSATMAGFSRRHFLAWSGSAAAAALAGPAGPAGAAMGPDDKFDLVIKGGDVLDPSQALRGKRDIGIRWGAIEAIENEIPAARAAKTIDATGKLVTPGLIDLHSHVYPYGSAIGIPAD